MSKEFPQKIIQVNVVFLHKLQGNLVKQDSILKYLKYIFLTPCRFEYRGLDNTHTDFIQCLGIRISNRADTEADNHVKFIWIGFIKSMLLQCYQ